MSNLKELSTNILDVLFPIECIGCGFEGKWICDECFLSIKIRHEEICPICERESENSAICFGCRNKTYLKGLLAASSYHDRLIKEAVHLFKYRFIQDLSLELGKILIEKFRDFPDIKEFVVMPVPLHSRRLRWRGFNQAELLATIFADRFGLEKIRGVLTREKNTVPQVEFSDRIRRINNIKDAFVCKSGERVKGKKIILVDDVATTLATLDECARVMRLAGAKEIWGAVVARG